MRQPAKNAVKPDRNNKARANVLLLQAASDGDVYLARLALEDGADVNTRDGRGRTPLLRAVGAGVGEGMNKFDAMEAQIKRLALNKQIPPLVPLLLQAGADVNLADKTNVVPLDIAVVTGNTALCQELIRHKADVNRKNRTSSTPLAVATGRHDADMVDTLLKAGANARVPGLAEGVSLLIIALYPSKSPGDEEESLMTLVGGLTDSLLGQTRQEQERNIVIILEKLIAAGADPNVVSPPGITPLITAALFGTPRAVRLLLARGARVDGAGLGGVTALHMASGRGRADTGRVLLEAGADPNATTQDGQTPLILAAGASDTATYTMVERLLKVGAQPDTRDKNGKTARDIAVEKKNTAIVQLLDTHTRTK